MAESDADADALFLEKATAAVHASFPDFTVTDPASREVAQLSWLGIYHSDNPLNEVVSRPQPRFMSLSDPDAAFLAP